MGNAVLMIAFHFPPAAMGSGHLRTVAFARHLPALGWDPIVLSARAQAYPQTLPLDDSSVPQGCVVQRAFALDAGRHFAVAGKYPGFLAQPDRWSSWWPAAIWQGLQLIRRHRVRAIWSTYPIMSAHCIARILSGLTHLPWVADFRDPVANSVSADNAFALASQHRWERRILRDASRVVFTTPGALRSYAERYPEACENGRLAVIENGFDATAFTDLPLASPRAAGRPLVLLHSGLLYREGRNPFPFFSALARLKDAGRVGADELKVVLRASGSEATYAQETRRLGLSDMVTLAPPVSNRDALVEQSEADALLLFQGQQFDRQIPAKLYEYLRIGRPIFALLGEQGDTAAVLRESGGAVVVPMDDVSAVERNLLGFIRDVRAGRVAKPEPGFVARHSRQAGASSLARLLEQAVMPDSSDQASM